MGDRKAWSKSERDAAKTAQAIAAGVEKRVAAMAKTAPPPPRSAAANVPDDWDITTGRGA
jgi:hypothetical protein